MEVSTWWHCWPAYPGICSSAAIGGRPAYQVLMETIQALPPDVQQRAARNLLVGLAVDEYKDEFRRGDYLIRNLVGVDR